MRVSNSTTRYAEVAVPLHVFQTFTYRLTPEQSAQAEVGSRAVVPLGRNLVTAYIVGLLAEPPENLTQTEIKDAHTLVDVTPVCSPEILQLARWVADYYACPIGEVEPFLGRGIEAIRRVLRAVAQKHPSSILRRLP